MCTFYFRLTRDFEGYRPRLYVGFGLIGVTYLVVVMNFFLSCRPFHHMWQISPDPGQFCYPAISPALVWVYLSFNVLTDLYLIAIPMPMLFRAAMPWWKRAWLVGLFSLGLFVVMAAILRVVLLVSVSLQPNGSPHFHEQKLLTCVSTTGPGQWRTARWFMGSSRDIRRGCHNQSPTSLPSRQESGKPCAFYYLNQARLLQWSRYGRGVIGRSHNTRFMARQEESGFADNFK